LFGLFICFGDKMRFEENKSIKNFGKKLGYLVAYFLFTTILYLIINVFYNKILNYFTVMLITLFIALIGVLVKRFLK